MPHKELWFRAKRYGYGWTPITWQGWVVTLGYLLLIYLNFQRLEQNAVNISDISTNFILETLLLTLILLWICVKTGEKPRWRWGK